MFGALGKFVERRIPMNLRVSIQKTLDFAGDDILPEKWLADTIILSIIIAVICFFVFLVLNLFVEFIGKIFVNYYLLSLILSFVIPLVLTAGIRYLTVSFKIDDRKVRCQEILPDFLSVVAMNVSAGMEPLSALYISLRPDFNPITDEMKKIRSLSLGSKSVVDQLSLLRTKIDSNALKTTVSIIERASFAGGDLAVLLESVSQDMRESNKVQKELETATKGYVIFIAFLAVLGVPLLLSVATLFLSIITVPNISGGLTSMLSINLSGKPIPAGQIEILFIILIIFGSISASFIFSVLWKGEVKHGVKYVPLMVPAALIVFFACKAILKSILGSFIGFG